MFNYNYYCSQCPLFCRQPSINVAGVWDTTFYSGQTPVKVKMTLQQNGLEVTGTYDFKGGQIRGIIVGNTLSGEWSQAPTYTYPKEKGIILFSFNPSATDFKGYWNYGLDTPPQTLQYSWNGHKRTPA